MKTVKLGIFTFDELNETAKEKAREWWREVSNYDVWFSECVISDFVEILEIMGFSVLTREWQTQNGKWASEPRVYFSGFYSQGDGASFEANYKHKRGMVKALHEYAPNDETLHAIAKRLQAVQKSHFYSLTACIRTRGSYSHEYTMQAAEINYRDESRDLSEAETEILECARDLARWVYKRLRDEYEYTQTAEYIDEILQVNEYEFLENGERWTK
jgi:hypothetical protein